MSSLADQAKVAKLGQTVKEAQQKLRASVRELTPPEGADALQFVAQVDATVKVLKEAGSSALVNPKWTKEGTNVADLVKHMRQNGLRFAPATPGTETAYRSVHSALVEYAIQAGVTPPAKK